MDFRLHGVCLMPFLDVFLKMHEFITRLIISNNNMTSNTAFFHLVLSVVLSPVHILNEMLTEWQ